MSIFTKKLVIFGQKWRFLRKISNFFKTRKIYLVPQFLLNLAKNFHNTHFRWVSKILMQEFLISWTFWHFLGSQSWKMAFFVHFCILTLLPSPGKHDKNQNLKNSRIRTVKHLILMMYTEIHANSIKTERLDRFLPKFTLKFMLFLI